MGLFINDAIILGWFLLQTTQVLRVYDVLSIHGWSKVKPAKNDDVIYEQPQILSLFLHIRTMIKIVMTRIFFKVEKQMRECDLNTNHCLGQTTGGYSLKSSPSEKQTNK